MVRHTCPSACGPNSWWGQPSGSSMVSAGCGLALTHESWGIQIAVLTCWDGALASLFQKGCSSSCSHHLIILISMLMDASSWGYKCGPNIVPALKKTKFYRAGVEIERKNRNHLINVYCTQGHYRYFTYGRFWDEAYFYNTFSSTTDISGNNLSITHISCLLSGNLSTRSAQ